MKVKLNEGIKPTIHNAFSTKQEAKMNPQMSKLFMDMLAKIYTNLGIACLREYTANAIDAHKAKGIKRPVEGVFYLHRPLLDVLGGKLFAKLYDNRILSNQPIVLDLGIGKTKLNYAREFIDFEASGETRSYVYEQICNVQDYLKEQTNDICSRFDPDAPANTVKEFVRKGINPIRILRNLDIDNLLPRATGTSRGLYGFEITIKDNKSISYSSSYYPEQSDVIDSILIVKDDDAKLNDKTVASRLATIVKNCSFRELKDFWGKDLDPSLTAISEILERIKWAVRKKSFEVIIVEKDHYDKLTYKDFAHVITSSKIDKEFNKMKKKTKQTAKPEAKQQLYLSSRGLYFGNTAEVKIRTHINSIIETIDWEANAKSGGKTLLLPIDTRHDKTHVPFKNGQTWRLLYNIMNPALYVKVTESQLREITEKTAQEEREILDYVLQNCLQKGHGLF